MITTEGALLTQNSALMKDVEEKDNIRLFAQIDVHGLIKLAGLAPLKRTVVSVGNEWL
jgi:hypothetical protein